jgi:RNA polymerase sigma factor (sigma-70 family)
MENFDPIQLYFKEIKEMGTLTPEENKAMWSKAYKGDKKTRKRLVEANLRLVIPIAKRYFRPGMDFLDLIEEGNMGLIRAVEKFNPHRKIHFSTYATYWIGQSVRRAVEEQTKTIRIPPHIWDGLSKLVKKWKRHKEKFNREPTVPELAKQLGLNNAQVENLLSASKLSQGTSSLEAPIDEEGSILVRDIISDKKGGTPESVTELLRTQAELTQAMRHLPSREQEIVGMRFGLGGKQPLSLEEVGAKLKLSRERIRQLETRALQRLKSAIIRLKLY